MSGMGEQRVSDARLYRYVRGDGLPPDQADTILDLLDARAEITRLREDNGELRRSLKMAMEALETA